jgi:hypothetical protein
MIKQKFLNFLVIVFLLIYPVTTFALFVDPAFNPNKLIEDSTFADTQTFGGADGIQKFLADKKSVLANTSPDFLIKLNEPDSVLIKQGLDDPQPNLGRLRTAAELIWDASKSSGLNPQVIIVTLAKEQSLIEGQFTSETKLQTALNRALGFGCPDGGGCGSLYPGFYYQLFGNFDSSGNRYLGAAKSLMKSYLTVGGRGPFSSKTGDVLNIANTLGNYDNISAEQSVMLSNNATAALYRYTPHVFNGNYNFWKFFQAWFKYPNGTLLKLADSVDIFIIQNGLKQLVPQFVALSRSLDLGKTIVISPNEFTSYTTDKPLGPIDNTLVSIAGESTKYVFLDNIKHPVSDLVIKQRGLDPNKVLSISAQDSLIFQSGNVLPPNDGTIIRGVKNQSVYLVDDGKIKMFSAYTFAQNNITPKKIVTVPDEEILTYAQNGFVAPKDGSLIKTAKDNTIYYAQSGLKQPITAEIFKNRGLSLKNVKIISDDEIAALPLGSFATPKDKTFYSVGSKTGPLYIFKEGSTHSISAYVAKQRGITPDYVFNADIANSWAPGIPVTPRDGSLIKGDGDGTVYLVKNGQLDPITGAAFKKRGYSFKNVVTLSQDEVNSYGKGEIIEK